MTERERALLEHMAQTLDNIEALLNEVLDRPRATTINISAWSKVQLERLARVLVDAFLTVMREKR